MFKSLITVALRNFRKDKTYSILNILGLTIGITVCILLVSYVNDELSFDRFHEKAERIYRISAFVQEPENSMKWSSTPFPMGPTLKKDYPEVEESVRITKAPRLLYKNGEVQFYEEKFIYADSNLFEIFTYSFLEGDPGTALAEPQSIVITENTAHKYFGKGKSTLGKMLQNNRGELFKITGVLREPPKNSHIQFNAVISLKSLADSTFDNWGSFGFYTYVLLRPGTDPNAFTSKMTPLYEKYLAAIFAQFNIKVQFGIIPVTSIHLHSDLEGEPEELGSMSYIYIFSAVALFMLIIACINYMNLTTARSARRSKEIGIRKVVGSGKKQLIAQFLTESVLITLIALVMSIAAVYLLLPAFNQLSGKQISFSSLINGKNALLLLAIVLITGFLGGSYPAFYLAGIRSLDVLKGTTIKGPGNALLRKILVGIQFTISITMIICTLVVFGQLQYLRQKDLGFNKEQLLSVTADGEGSLRSKVHAFKQEISKNRSVAAVSTSQNIPGNSESNFSLLSVESNNGFIEKGVDNYGIDENYLNTLGIQLTQGRNFSNSLPGDTLNSIIVNEAMSKSFGWVNALGKRIKRAGDTGGNFYTVVGVIKDFHQKSLYNPISPLILFYRPNSNRILVKLTGENIPASLEQLNHSWQSIFPEQPFRYTFLDQDFNSQYAADQRRGKIFTGFSTLTLMITCLGLLGLIAFTTEQRKKEIGIRKVVGAGTITIVSMILKSFMVLIFLSCFIAFP